VGCSVESDSGAFADLAALAEAVERRVAVRAAATYALSLQSITDGQEDLVNRISGKARRLSAAGTVPL
jgi:hypothetical protein